MKELYKLKEEIVAGQLSPENEKYIKDGLLALIDYIKNRPPKDIHPLDGTNPPDNPPHKPGT